MKSRQTIYTLEMRRPVGDVRYLCRKVATVLYVLGDRGQGEGMPLKYKRQSAIEAPAVLDDLSAGVTAGNIGEVEFHEERARALYPNHSGALAAFSMALWDARGRAERKPLHALLGAPAPSHRNYYTINHSDSDQMVAYAEEAAHLPALTIRLGRDLESDLAVMKRIRAAAPDATLRVDASARWTPDIARAIIPRLADMGVTSVEQPFPMGSLEECRRLHRESPLPIIADEDVQYLASLPGMRGCVAGINIKLMKCGGIGEAVRMIQFARQEGWSVHIGCTFETRLGLSAACHLSALADSIEADSHLMTSNDPFAIGGEPDLTADLPLGVGPGIGLPLLTL